MLLEGQSGWPALGQAAGAEAERDSAPHTRGWPPREWPTQTQLTYTKELITVLLLVLALPWLVSNLMTRPGVVLAGLGKRAAGKAAG